jgi:adenylate cyclase
MSLEIERKFLVRDAGWRRQARDVRRLRQGYLANTPGCSVRVRIAAGDAWLSVKAMQAGPARAEFEYPIPVADAASMLEAFAQGPLVEKLRHRVPVGRHCYELDEFEGENRGLVLAEIELGSVSEEFPRPDWLGDQVTEDLRFHNFRLAEQPFSGWPAAVRAGVAAGRRAGAPP